ncbi:MAG: neuromedin U [Alphaproteobacteria bacterium]|nr:neuromedin U [Alphaproteobacteria bacterium]
MSLKKSHKLFSLYMSFFFLIYLPIPASYGITDLDVLKGTQNPLSTWIVLPIRNNFNFGFLDKNYLQDLLQLEPQIPIKFNNNIMLLARPILPVLSQINTTTLNGNVFGIGDLNPQFYFSHNTSGTVSWGIGPAFAFPTATNGQLGTGKVSGGPAVIFAASPSNWVFGFYANNVWSFAGAKNRSKVNLFNMEAFVFYNISNDWFLASTPNISANWEAEGQKWALPVGGGVGCLFKINNQNVIASLQSFYNVVTPSEVNTKWSIRFSLYFTFPEENPLSLPFL